MAGESLEDFYRRLRAADWLYGYSDSGEVYRRGRDAMDDLRRMTAQSEAHQRMFDAMRRAGEAGRQFPEFDALVSGVCSVPTDEELAGSGGMK